MQCSLSKCAMYDHIAFGYHVCLSLEPVKVLCRLLDNRICNFLKDVVTQFTRRVTRQNTSHIRPVEPTRGVRQKSPHFTENDLVRTTDAEAVLPFVHELPRCSANERNIACGRIQIRPFIDQRHGYHGHQSRVEQTGHDRPSAVDDLRSCPNCKVAQNFAHLNDRVGIVNFENERPPLQTGQRSSYGRTLAIEKRYYRFNQVKR